MRLHLHELDSDHEGLLRVRPVQLLGSVADLGEAGGQIHSRRAVLGQLPQGHQLGGGGVCRKESSRLAKSTPLLPRFHLQASRVHTASKLRAAQGAARRTSRAPLTARKLPGWAFMGSHGLSRSVTGDSVSHLQLASKAPLKAGYPLPHLLQGPGRAESHTRKSGTPPIAGPTPTWSICTARCTRARASL